MSSSKALKKKISKRAKQKKNIQVKNSIRLKNAKLAETVAPVVDEVTSASATETVAEVASGNAAATPAAAQDNS
jgi:hypothetical protein